LIDRYRSSREPITFLCVPPGDGRRSALDRDLNGFLDGDETPGAAERTADNGGMQWVHSAQ
jgi:hypothetical protein